MRILMILLLSTTGACHAHSEEHSVLSPDRRNRMAIAERDGNLTIAIARDNVPVILPTPISITIDGQRRPLMPRATTTQMRSGDDAVTPVAPTIGAQVNDRFNETLFQFDGNVALRVRAYDDGVAYRWETSIERPRTTVDAEQFGANLAEDFTVYFPIPNGEGFFSHQECVFEKKPVSQIDDDKLGPAPLLAELGGDDFLLISDVNVEGYPGLWFSGTGAGSLQAAFPHYPLKAELEGDRNLRVVQQAEYLAQTSGRREYPWRAFVLADAAGLLTSTMLYNLADPSRIDDPSWIRPGKVAWDWWNALNVSDVPFVSGVNQDTYRHYIDFAAEMRAQYVILDEGWSRPGPENLLSVVEELDISALVEYGRRQQVGIILWMTSAALEANFNAAFEQFERWGVAGLKIDFMQRDDQVMMEFLYRAAREAARRRMIVDFHGGSKPTGITRTWPNVLTIESVMGSEQAKWGENANPDMSVLLPYARMTVGPMDYTPGAMVNLQQRDFQPMFHRPASLGTRAHQLAMYVVFLSPLQMLADSPTHYRMNPQSLPFLRQVPVTWDETVVLQAAVGEVAAVARRKDRHWYVGALTNWKPRELKLPLEFLDEGVAYQLTGWSDGLNADKYGDDVAVAQLRVDRRGELDVRLAPGGGYAAILEPAN